MTEITAAKVKELRESTGAGMLDCKKALVERLGDDGVEHGVRAGAGLARTGGAELKDYTLSYRARPGDSYRRIVRPAF